MNNEHVLNNEELDEIFQYIKCIAICVYKGDHFYIYDWKENFILNMKLDIDGSLNKGIISKSEYDLELASQHYRNGIWQLTKENFEQYLKSEGLIKLSRGELEELLFYGFHQIEIERLYSVVENQLAYNAGISDEGENSDFLKINQISSRLPLFYINFDTKVYLHMNWDRIHEDYAYDDWFAKALDFGYLIPDEFCYWKIDGKDFWKFRQI